MKKHIVFILFSLLLLAPTAYAADGLPMTLAGITLGEDVSKYEECCDLALASAIPDAPFLSERHIKPDFVPGVRGGSLTYGNCNEVGKLVRIKLKFHDRSQTLFKELLAKYKKAYGKPDNYEGDAFKNVIAWVWDFSEGDQEVTLMLMWSRDKEMRPGVSIKMTLKSALDAEYDCFRKQLDRANGPPSKIKSLNDFVPK